MRRFTPKVGTTTGAALVPLLLGLCGCSSAPPPKLEVNPDGERRPSTAPLGRLRFDGIYECRGIKLIGSSGGLPGLWTTPPTQAQLVSFLKFEADGNGYYTPAEEPFTTGQAAGRFAGVSGSGRYVVRGRYTVNGSEVSLILGEGAAAVEYTGPIYADHLDLRVTPSFHAPEQKQFWFVAWPPGSR